MPWREWFSICSPDSDMATEFAHRQNADGTFDSICLSCDRTVASAQSEAELSKGEKEHSCPTDGTFVSRILRVLRARER